MKELRTKILNRFALIYILFLLLGIVAIVRIVKLQFFEREKWIQEEKKYTLRNMVIEPNRGNIFSDDGSLLKSSIPFYEVRFDSQVEALTDKIFNKNVDSLAYLLGKEFGKPTSYYYNKLVNARRNGNRYLFIAKRVSNTQLQHIKNFPIFREGKYKGGLILKMSTIRVQPFNYATRTLGYLMGGNHAVVGLEGAYDKYLKGQKGLKVMQRLTGNVWKEFPYSDKENQIEAKNGIDIQTTINLQIQDITHHALLRQLQEQEADHGTAIVMEVKTGEIKAISNLGRSKKGEYREFFNYAIGEPYEPGSTFKLASFVAAMEDGYITNLSDTINTGNGVTYFYNHKMQDSHHGGYGTISIQQVFEKSSNVGVSKLIYKYYKNQPKKFIERLYALHIGDKLG
ncbi:MAG: peptidoglycan glycosyltransferase, partial [Bacteroidales bacterium]|nr:peptidoglycan glycosyltransferase [Bacteroidales bacterium]